MKQIVTALFCFICFSVGKSQMPQDKNCRLLYSFLSDKKVREGLAIDRKKTDTVTIIDPHNYFNNCRSYQLKNDIITVDTNSAWNTDPEYRKDVEQWKKNFHIHIFKIEGNRIYFFHKPNNVSGNVSFREKRGQFVAMKYEIGQF